MYDLAPVRSVLRSLLKYLASAKGRAAGSAAWASLTHCSVWSRRDSAKATASRRPSCGWEGQVLPAETSTKHFCPQFAAVLEIKTADSSNFSSTLPRAQHSKSPVALSDKSLPLQSSITEGFLCIRSHFSWLLASLVTQTPEYALMTTIYNTSCTVLLCRVIAIPLNREACWRIFSSSAVQHVPCLFRGPDDGIW